MQKIIAALLAFLMSILGIIPAVQPADAYTQAEWYAKVAENFGLVTADNADAIQACKDQNVLVGEYDADAAITDALVGKSLAVAAVLITD